MGWMMGPCFDDEHHDCPDGGCDCACHDPDEPLHHVVRLEAENAALRERIEQLQRPTATRERLARAEVLLQRAERYCMSGETKDGIRAYFEEVRDGE